MNEYGIFQSIVEGDQAEAYKKKKAAEQRKSDHAANNRIFHRGAAMVADKGEDAVDKEMDSKTEKMRSGSKSFKNLTDKLNSGKGSDDDLRKAHYAMDAKDRHDRRHPNSESTIYNQLV